MDIQVLKARIHISLITISIIYLLKSIQLKQLLKKMQKGIFYLILIAITMMLIRFIME